MRLRRGLLIMVVTWLMVVLVGATAVWAVISRAGEDLVTGTSQPGLAATSSARVTTVAPSEPLERRSHRSKPPRETAEAEPTQAESPSTAASPEPTPPPPAPSSGASSSQPAQPAAQTTRTGTWNGKPGTVSMTCRADGTRGNYSVYARSGWVAETEQEGGGLEVHFHRQGGDGEIELKATCVAGKPVFREHGDGD